MATLEGMRLGTCRVLRRIGGGGMGEVYLAEQATIGRRVVVKVVREIVREVGQAAARPDTRAQTERQFIQEARAIAALDHPHILPLYEYGEQDDIGYLVMPYIEHGSLADLLRRPDASDDSAALAPPLPPPLVADVIDQCADALQFAHLRGVIHRDVKPGNLLVRVLSHEANGQDAGARRAPSAAPTTDAEASRGRTAGRLHILLADFGLARFMSGLDPDTGTTGTPLYSAPEQYAGRPVPATDQYALACVAHFLLSGQPVFQGTVAELYHQHISVDPLPVTRVNPLLPPAVDTVLLRALAKDPAARFPSVLEFARALRAALDPTTPVSRPLWPAGAPPAGAPGPPPPALSFAEHRRDRRPGEARQPRDPPSPLPDEVTEPASDGRSRRTAATGGGWAASSHPDAPGSPIPRRGRGRRRLLALMGALVLAVAALGGAGWGVTAYLANVARSAHTVAIARSGVVSLAHAPELPSAGAGARTPTTPLLARPRWPADESSAIAQAADHVAALPSLPPAPPLPAAGLAPRQTIQGPGQARTGSARPGQLSVGASGRYVVAALDDALQIASAQPSGPSGQPGEAHLIAAAGLFAPVLRRGDTLGQPRVLFDADARRWVIALNEVAGAPDAVTAGYFDLAISDGAEPLAPWHVYQFSTAAPAFGACSWADDPRLGGNAASYTLTGNTFACGAAAPFRGAALWDVPKPSFLRGAGARVYLFTGFANARQQPVFALTPAVQAGAGTTQWLVSDDAGYVDRGQTSDRVIVWAATHAGAADEAPPTLVGLVVTVPYGYADPPAVASGGARVRIGDARPAQVQMIGGHLYVAFATAVNWAGDATTRTGTYWLDIVPQSPAPSAATTAGHPALAARVNQAGILGAERAYVFAPAIQATAGGDVALVAAAGGALLAPRLLYAVHRTGDPPGALGRLASGQPAAGPLALGDGQGGTALAMCAGEPAAGGAPAPLRVGGVVTGGAPPQWQSQLWSL